MLPNTQKLTSQMAMMPDAALKQMAMMHKNDPYTLPLIIAEDSRRKEMRQAAMTRMATPQPNVADQQIAQMGVLPENQGIGALNAPNLERMADGGIAGYADGGQQPGMFNYAQMAPAVDLRPDSGVTPRSMASGGIASFGVGGNVTSTDGGKTWSIDVPYSTPRNPTPPAVKALAGKTFSSATEAQAALDAASGGTSAPSLLTSNKPTSHDFDAVNTTSPKEEPKIEPKVEPKIEPKIGNYEFPVPKAPGGLGGSQLQSLIAPPSIEDMKKAQSAFRVNPNQVIDPFQAERQGIVDSQQRMTEEELRNFETSQKERGDVYANRKERLTGQEEKLKGKEQENQGLSLLEAGLAIFGGTSPFAGANIAQGREGIKSYKEGQDKIERARDRLNDAKDRIEDLETNYKDMTDRERRGLKSNINKATTDGQRLMLDGVTQAYGMDRADATNLTKTYLENADKAKTRSLQALISGNEQAGANYRAQLGLTAMPEQIKIAKILGGPTGDVAAGLKRLTEIQAGKKTVAQSYEDYMKAWAGKDTTMGGMLSPQQYMQQYRQIQLLANPPNTQEKATGQVRE